MMVYETEQLAHPLFDHKVLGSNLSTDEIRL